MVIPKLKLEAAAFWDSVVCLECETILDDLEGDACPQCGAGKVSEWTILPAEAVLRAAKLVEGEDD